MNRHERRSMNRMVNRRERTGPQRPLVFEELGRAQIVQAVCLTVMA
jgi:hypothetical protein